jgi:hypothetical protein
MAVVLVFCVGTDAVSVLAVVMFKLLK